ncbi:hypothetical protein LCGC14_0783550 [marine sediment metagenome]|uniref:Dephospho-CoA kinase n=1 Tax=marine sediment metagenome TaxID=412755 RepID=A0A0F9QEM7_9ZZZZ
MKIIGISGKKQSGKTTVTDFLELKLQCAGQIAFADYLKEIVCVCFGTVLNKVNGSDEDKNEILSCGKSIREVLQIIGTDWFRSLDTDCWVRAYKEKVAYDDGEDEESDFLDYVILTPDVRFPNEVKCIQDLGGHVIRLLRNPHNDQHESETALDHMEKQGNATRKEIIARKNPLYALVWDSDNGFDAIIDNREMTIAEQNEAVWRLINQKGWL